MSEPCPSRTSGGIRGAMSRVYDVFVDWDSRLAREMPGIEAHLAAVGAQRVLDLGCATGRHVAALRARGFDAHGADASEDMLKEARDLLGSEERLHLWRMGGDPPAALERAAPFDAAIAMGNVWPFLVDEADARATTAALMRIVRPGGLVLLGLKAFEVRRRSGNPYLPLLRRVDENGVLWFVRFVDFDVALEAGAVRVAEMHMSVLRGDASAVDELGQAEALLHRVSRLRSWDPAELAAWLVERGFVDVHVSGKLDDPHAAVASEDVFANARLPLG